ncbi:MAG: TetR/AcrR family transcriptional regulator [Acidimicrobiales bacterium]
MGPRPARTSATRTARSRRTRTALVEAVTNELRAAGAFDADGVASRADCSPATFYSHFGTKDEALTAAFRLVLDSLLDLSASLLTLDRIETLGLDKTLITMVDRQADFFRHETLVFRAALAQLPTNRGLRDAYRSAETVDVERLSTLIETGQARGLIRLGPPDVLANAVLVLAQGSITREHYALTHRPYGAKLLEPSPACFNQPKRGPRRHEHRFTINHRRPRPAFGRFPSGRHRLGRCSQSGQLFRW